MAQIRRSSMLRSLTASIKNINREAQRVLKEGLPGGRHASELMQQRATTYERIRDEIKSKNEEMLNLPTEQREWFAEFYRLPDPVKDSQEFNFRFAVIKELEAKIDITSPEEMYKVLGGYNWREISNFLNYLQKDKGDDWYDIIERSNKQETLELFQLARETYEESARANNELEAKLKEQARTNMLDNMRDQIRRSGENEDISEFLNDLWV